MKNTKGITLIALVITIIVLIILAGVAIATLTGENGILAKAKLAKDITKQKADEENNILKQYEKLLGIDGKQELPDNTEETEAGTIVKMPNGWSITTPNEVSTKDGIITIPAKKIANVYAISDGAGNTVPVPYDFYYVGGSVESGVVISDNPEDKNKYKGLENVPDGVSYNSDGTVNKENSELKGNQFVWIPCAGIEEYKKTNFGLQNSTEWDILTNSAEKVQIGKYNGFYVGRYEAGTSKIKLMENVKWENASSGNTINGWGWQNQSFIASKVIEGKITNKAGEIPYYHADYTTAVEMSENMYDTQYVRSGLITGTMWDVMMNFVTTDKGNYADLKNSTWGNYNNNTSISYTQGRGRYLEVNASNGSTSDAKVSDNNYYYGIRTTASSEEVKRKNLYDIAGNLWEWTQEMSNKTNEPDLKYNVRGGSFINNVTDYPTCYRAYENAYSNHTNVGFRPVLYIK